MAIDSTVTRYHPLLVTLHWLLAVLIAGELVLGFVLAVTENTNPAKLAPLRVHVVMGVLILLLMLSRLGVRMRTPRPPPVQTGNTLQEWLARTVHAGLYVVIVLMALSGLGTGILAGLPGILFGASGRPLPDDFGIYPPRIAHGILAWVLVALLALHLAGVVYHQFIRRDGLLRRMGFGDRRG